MAIDSRNKRASAIYVGLPWRGLLPAPDNTIDQADRQQVALMYAGILAILNVVLPAPPERTMLVDAENRIMRVPAENRVMRVPAENRVMKVSKK